MGMAPTLQSYFREHPAPYDLLYHHRSATSLETARTSHLPPERLAKAVVLDDGQRCLVAVLPATRHVELGELNTRTGRVMRLLTEDEFSRYFPDCEPGAVPALAGAYGLEVIWDESLAEEPDLYFEAGDHRTLVHMKTRDFIEMMRESGNVGQFAAPPYVLAAWEDDDDSN